MYEVLYDSAKISSLRSIRDVKTHEESVAVHRAFGDIFMAYEAYKRKLISDGAPALILVGVLIMNFIQFHSMQVKLYILDSENIYTACRG